MRCGRCGNENASANRFCGMCGAPLVEKTQAGGPSAGQGVRGAGTTAVPRASAGSNYPTAVKPLPVQYSGAQPAPPAANPSNYAAGVSASTPARGNDAPPAASQYVGSPLPSFEVESRDEPEPIISGPSFLGLNKPAARHGGLNTTGHDLRSSGSVDYLLDDEEEPKRGWGKVILFVVALALAGGFGYLHWKQGGFDWLTAGNRKPAAAQGAANAGSVAADTGSSGGTSAAPNGAAAPGSVAGGETEAAGGAAANPSSANPSSANPSSTSPEQSAPAQATPGTAPAQAAPSNPSAQDNSSAGGSAQDGSAKDSSAKDSSAQNGSAQNSPPINSAAAGQAAGSKTAASAGNAPAKAEPQTADSDADTESSDEEQPAVAKADARKPAATKLAATKPSAAKPVDSLADAERYLYGRGVPQDCDRGLRMLKSAAGQSDAKAMISLGKLYSAGMCAPRDLPTAYRWYAMALHKQPENQPVQEDLQRLWSQMTQPERQLAIKLSQ